MREKKKKRRSVWESREGARGRRLPLPRLWTKLSAFFFPPLIFSCCPIATRRNCVCEHRRGERHAASPFYTLHSSAMAGANRRSTFNCNSPKRVHHVAWALANSPGKLLPSRMYGTACFSLLFIQVQLYLYCGIWANISAQATPRVPQNPLCSSKQRNAAHENW